MTTLLKKNVLEATKWEAGDGLVPAYGKIAWMREKPERKSLYSFLFGFDGNCCERKEEGREVVACVGVCVCNV